MYHTVGIMDVTISYKYIPPLNTATAVRFVIEIIRFIITYKHITYGGIISSVQGTY